VLTAWDQNHRDDPEFPEVNFNREFIDRDNFFKNTVPRAVAVLVDAKESKENLVKRYGCDAQRVHVAPFLPSLDIGKNPDIDLKKKYGIARKYIFYPAQFWAHKNHVYILDGLNILRQKHGIEIDAVFSGSDKGKNLKYVLSYAGKLGLGDAIHYVGFVPNEDMSSFYRQSIALVMPTYLGPTNIPPLEAFVLGCPVCYSDLPGLRDQVGDAAFLMDLKDPASMAKQVATILNDKKLVQQKIAKGKAIVAGWTEDDYWNVLKDIFESYRVKQHCWKDSGVS
jgi:glycosyltransferase involved in cell wall biosynthesis